MPLPAEYGILLLRVDYLLLQLGLQAPLTDDEVLHKLALHLSDELIVFLRVPSNNITRQVLETGIPMDKR